MYISPKERPSSFIISTGPWIFFPSTKRRSKSSFTGTWRIFCLWMWILFSTIRPVFILRSMRKMIFASGATPRTGGPAPSCVSSNKGKDKNPCFSLRSLASFGKGGGEDLRTDLVQDPRRTPHDKSWSIVGASRDCLSDVSRIAGST